MDVADFPSIIHFDIPEDGLQYLQRVMQKDDTIKDQLCLTFCTDLELADIRRLEQSQGKKMQQMDLPDDLYIMKEKPKKKIKEDL
jgi:ATP-dependent RNA helicase RhlE